MKYQHEFVTLSKKNIEEVIKDTVKSIKEGCDDSTNEVFCVTMESIGLRVYEDIKRDKINDLKKSPKPRKKELISNKPQKKEPENIELESDDDEPIDEEENTETQENKDEEQNVDETEERKQD